MYFKTCPDCGANLDPGERCDCKTAIHTKGERPCLPSISLSNLNANLLPL